MGGHDPRMIKHAPARHETDPDQLTQLPHSESRAYLHACGLGCMVYVSRAATYYNNEFWCAGSGIVPPRLLATSNSSRPGMRRSGTPSRMDIPGWSCPTRSQTKLPGICQTCKQNKTNAFDDAEIIRIAMGILDEHRKQGHNGNHAVLVYRL